MLSGISSEVAELLKDRPIGHYTFQKLRKMKPIRQLEVAELMVSANNYTFSYVNALLATSKAADLHQPDALRKATGLSTEAMAKTAQAQVATAQAQPEIRVFVDFIQSSARSLAR